MDSQLTERLEAAWAGGDRNQVVAVLEAARAASSDPEVSSRLAAAYFARAKQHREVGRRAEEFADVDRAVSTAPDNLHYRRERMMLHLFFDRVDEALADADENLRLEPEIHGCWFDKACVLLCGHRYDEALAAIDQALARAYGDADNHRVRSVILREAGRAHEAVLAAHRAVALAPEDARALRSRALAFTALGDEDSACADRLRARSVEASEG